MAFLLSTVYEDWWRWFWVQLVCRHCSLWHRLHCVHHLLHPSFSSPVFMTYMCRCYQWLSFSDTRKINSEVFLNTAIEYNWGVDLFVAPNETLTFSLSKVGTPVQNYGVSWQRHFLHDWNPLVALIRRRYVDMILYQFVSCYRSTVELFLVPWLHELEVTKNRLAIYGQIVIGGMYGSPTLLVIVAY